MKPQRPENVGSIYFFWCVFREEEEGKEKWGRSSTTKHCRLVRCCRNCRRSGNDFQSIFWKVVVVVGFSNREQKWKVINKKEKKKESRGCGVRVCPAWRITAESRAAACGVYRNTKDDRRSCVLSAGIQQKIEMGKKFIHAYAYSSSYPVAQPAQLGHY